ncbi:hypothetical protein SLS56_002809 [Neofusicoccum ribis]|uniref:Uncharacterized protein n=1 Tax=Neofusicoccum ribis TaxID=45134 RepID=A0ABR3T3G0_9PEZI
MSPPRINSKSPIAGMQLYEKKALFETSNKITLKWTDPTTKQVFQVTDIPKPMFLKFSPSAASHNAHKRTKLSEHTYDLGPTAHLNPAAGIYLPAASPQPNVLRHLQALIAAQQLDVRCVVHAWRGKLMDAVRDAGVTRDALALLHAHFSDEAEPTVLRHMLNSAVHAELHAGDADPHPETVALNRYVYAEGNPGLAVMKKAVEIEVAGKMAARAEKEEKRARQAEARKRLCQKRQREQEKHEMLDRARDGDRILSELEVDALSKHAGPTTAFVSNKLR